MSLRTKVVAALTGATMLGGAITGVIKHNEGLSLTAYKDSAGIPTICYGETKGVKMGQRATLSDCQQGSTQKLLTGFLCSSLTCPFWVPWTSRIT